MRSFVVDELLDLRRSFVRTLLVAVHLAHSLRLPSCSLSASLTTRQLALRRLQSHRLALRLALIEGRTALLIALIVVLGQTSSWVFIRSNVVVQLLADCSIELKKKPLHLLENHTQIHALNSVMASYNETQ